MARTKGSPNRLGAQARENIAAVFTRLGGTAAMAEWAKDHESEFYRIYAQLMPREVTADVRVTSEVELTDEQLAAIATGSGESAADPSSGEAQSPSLQ